MTAPSTYGATMKSCFLKACHFLLAHFGYTYKLNYNVRTLKRYISLFAVLICYSIISLKTIFSDDFASFLVNAIWTIQIFLTTIVNHLEVKDNRKEISESALPTNGGPTDGTAWGHRLICYTIALLFGIVIISYFVLNDINNIKNICYDIFALIAYLIALFDGMLDVVAGMFDATID